MPAHIQNRLDRLLRRRWLRFGAWFGAALASGLTGSSASQADDVVVTLNRDRAPIFGPGPVQQSFILREVPNPAANLILFIGGNGKLNVAPDGRLSINANNFLLRSRHLFAASGFNVIVMDAATDFLARPGGLRTLRTSDAHMSDIAAVIEYLRNTYPGLAVWLIGTSRGSISAGNAAAVLGPSPSGPDGLVLTASVTRPTVSDPDSLQGVPFEQVTVPSLIAHHKDDDCFVSPPEDAHDLKRRLEPSVPRIGFKLFEGGLPALSEPCAALSPHGFFGIEPKTVNKITNWIQGLPD